MRAMLQITIIGLHSMSSPYSPFQEFATTTSWHASTCVSWKCYC